MASAMETDDLEHFDLEAYATAYAGPGKLYRLMFIAKAASGALELEALRLAADELRQSYNVQAYTEVAQSIAGRLGPTYAPDEAWAAATRSRAASEQARLEHNLTGSKTSLRKESIRQGHTELAAHFVSTGDIQEAFKCYARTRDFCTTPGDVLGMCLSIVTTALTLKSWSNVYNYASKADGVPDLARSPVLQSKIRCAEALAQLQDKRYKQAARKLTEDVHRLLRCKVTPGAPAQASPEMGGAYGEVLSAQDVATWGSLCALATFTRRELKALVIDNLGFREYLETTPEVREMVAEFYAARYSAALERLHRLAPLLRLDMHLAAHLPALTQALRARALVQHAQSFSAVRLPAMATTFACSAEEVEAELVKLIKDGQVAGRIDSHAGVLHARRPDARRDSFRAALAAGEDYLYNAQASLLRASLAKYDLIQRPVSLGKKGLAFREAQ